MKQKSHSPELISRPLVTRASQENDAAKIRKIIESAKEKLKILSETYLQIYNPKGFTGKYVDTTEIAKVNVSPTNEIHR